MKASTNTLPACVPAEGAQDWDFFIAENAATPHCGITLNGANFICSPLDQSEQISYICDALQCQHMTEDPYAAQVRAALKNCLGFVEAWFCHLRDQNQVKSAATVNGVLSEARICYEKSNRVAQGLPISEVSGRTEKSILGHIALESLDGCPEDVAGWGPYVWLKANALFCSKTTISSGGELLINLARTFNDVPVPLGEIFAKARLAGIRYLEFSLS